MTSPASASCRTTPRAARRFSPEARCSPAPPSAFPHGGHTTAVKLAEVRQALNDGATELDMVINISQARSGNWDYVASEIRMLTEATHDGGAKIKVIFENAYLDDAAKIRLCEICGEIGVDWVKTSTGYASSGATLADLALMRRHSPPSVQVKAAGGIRTLDALLEVRALGVTRVGATRTAEMLNECRQRLGLPAIAAQTRCARRLLMQRTTRRHKHDELASVFDGHAFAAASQRNE